MQGMRQSHAPCRIVLKDMRALAEFGLRAVAILVIVIAVGTIEQSSHASLAPL